MGESFENGTEQRSHREAVKNFLTTFPAFTEVELVDQQEHEGVYTTTFNGLYEFEEYEFPLLAVLEGPLQKEENVKTFESNEIRIIVGEPKSSISLTIEMFEETSVLSARTRVYKDDEGRALPRQMGTTLYNDLVFSFFQHLAEKEHRPVLHVVKHGSVSNIKLDRDKWLSIFEKMLIENNYEHKGGEGDAEERWERLYTPSSGAKL